MNVSGYLYVSKRGKLRLTQRRGMVQDDEIAIKLHIDVPSSWFADADATLTAALPERGEPGPVEGSLEIITPTRPWAPFAPMGDTINGQEK